MNDRTDGRTSTNAKGNLGCSSISPNAHIILLLGGKKWTWKIVISDMYMKCISDPCELDKMQKRDSILLEKIRDPGWENKKNTLVTTTERLRQRLRWRWPNRSAEAEQEERKLHHDSLEFCLGNVQVFNFNESTQVCIWIDGDCEMDVREKGNTATNEAAAAPFRSSTIPRSSNYKDAPQDRVVRIEKFNFGEWRH